VIAGYLAGACIESGRDGVVTVVTAEPMADLLDLLVEIPIIPVQDDGAAVGAGPYTLDQVAESEVRAVRFERYWGDWPPHGTVRWVREPDQQAQVEALLAGEVDLIVDLPAPDRERIQASGRLQVVDTASPTCVAFLCNAANGPCADARVRRALNLALDVEELIRAAGKEGARPLNGPLTELHLGHDPETPPYRRDLDAAQALLDESGYPHGPQLVIDVPTRLPDEAPALGELLVGQFAEIGVEAEVRSFEDRPGYAEMVRAKRIDDLCCFDSSPLSTYRMLREKLHGGVRGPWWQGYANPEADRLLNKAAATVGLPERQALYRRAYRLIHGDAPWLFLYNPRLTWASVADVVWRPNAAGYIQLMPS
jgi:peptide/nickel transport system substrate-binding protein